MVAKTLAMSFEKLVNPRFTPMVTLDMVRAQAFWNEIPEPHDTLGNDLAKYNLRKAEEIIYVHSYMVDYETHTVTIIYEVLGNRLGNE